MSWKVRRSAAKVLAAIIETRSDLMQQLYETVAPALINRFKEREESVRADILQTFITLLRQTSVYGGASSSSGEEHRALRRFSVSSFGEELNILPDTPANSGTAMDVTDG